MRLSIIDKRYKKKTPQSRSIHSVYLVIAFLSVILRTFHHEIRSKSRNYVNFPAFDARTKMTCSLFTNFIIVTSFYVDANTRSAAIQ